MKRLGSAEFINDFNSQHKNDLKVTQEFKDEVTPILERVLRREGVGMTDEQMLVFLFGKDIALKGQQFIVARQQMGDIISMLKEQTDEMKKETLGRKCLRLLLLLHSPEPPQYE
jgi:hypothetical protein